MNNTAFIFNGLTISWSGIIIALAAICGVILFFSRAIKVPGMSTAAALTLPAAVILALVLGRAFHWYCRADEYTGLAQAFSDFSIGGFSLIGAAVGCFIASLAIRATGLCSDLGQLLDAAAPGAALTLCLGRLSFLFSYADRGKMLIQDAAMQHFPLASAVINSTSGATEWRFATFAFQAILCGIICIICLALGPLLDKTEKRNGRKSHGACFIIFVLCWLFGEIVLDSTRYDALFLRSNGFVSFMQIFAAIVIVGIFTALSIQNVRMNRLNARHFIMWSLFLAGLGCAGYMEYYVQRHGDLYVFSYSIMALGLLLSLTCSLMMLAGTLRKKAVPPAEAN